MRDLSEERDIKVDISSENYYMTVKHVYPDFAITMHSYICRVNTRNFVRKEHVSHAWLNVKELKNLDWAAADLPIVDKLMEDMA